METNTNTEAVQVKRMTRVLVKTAATLGRGDACYLVNAYYAMQRQRESAEAQLRRASDSRPHEVIAWVIEQDRIVEKQIKRVLDEWSNAIPAARWAKGIIGVGPMIAASLAAHIDISKCRTVGQIWRFAGYDPTLKWARGTKCPWNRHLKRVCWLAGESFVKTSGHEDGFYGRLYLARKRSSRSTTRQASSLARHARSWNASKSAATPTRGSGTSRANCLPPRFTPARSGGR